MHSTDDSTPISTSHQQNRSSGGREQNNPVEYESMHSNVQANQQMDGSSRIRVQFWFLLEHARVEDAQVSHVLPLTVAIMNNQSTILKLFSMLLQRVKEEKESLRVRLLEISEEMKVSYQLIIYYITHPFCLTAPASHLCKACTSLRRCGYMF